VVSTAYFSGGVVEHEVSLLRIAQYMSTLLSDGYSNGIQLFMLGGILFFVIEKKRSCKGLDNVAQLFLELLCKL